ncbi:TetR/AcrR family transcriptional regulator C-terminal domain-containing protein [Streptomyces halobius]|uniref:TetR/AcrR family transcriptional regulator C-terminal domain-containing protein n=1 Tax=Streptomyces halobius TaxID=2879846 RepID=A0ABY4M6R0_9ACTN|nr:TetR/AcrR family transcriptional regulator C-terminal domain-containing protein [Streptomyces halobius]UQA93447.1 TetR/AcrR family transcriptional regulator C-terminal domain-containing protein [Streptomyces halobius]
MAVRLDRNLVVETALRLLNEVGLEGLTLRRIAKELNVQAPALYWHFKNKQALLDEMATEMFRRMTASLLAGTGPETDGPRDDWQEVLLNACRGLRRALLEYRDGGKVFSGTRMTDESHAASQEALLSRLTAAGFTPGEAARAWWTAYNFTIGLVIEEQSVHPDPGEPDSRDPAYDLENRARRLGESHPLAVTAGHEMFGDIEAGFEAGLRIIVAGVAATVGPDAGK